MRRENERRERRDSLGGCLAEAGMEGALELAAALPWSLGVPLFVAIAFVFGITWLLRWLIDAMISRG